MCDCNEFSDEYIRDLYKNGDISDKGYGHFLYWQIQKYDLLEYQFNLDLKDYLKGRHAGLNDFYNDVKLNIKTSYYNGRLNLDRWLQEAVRKDLIPNGDQYTVDLHLDVAIRLYFRYMMENFISKDLLFIACVELMNSIIDGYGFDLKIDECQKLIQEIDCISQNSIINDCGILKQTVLKCFPDLALKVQDTKHFNTNIKDAKLDPDKEFIVSFDASENRPEDEVMKITPSENKFMTGILSKGGYFVPTNQNDHKTTNKLL